MRRSRRVAEAYLHSVSDSIIIFLIFQRETSSLIASNKSSSLFSLLIDVRITPASHSIVDNQFQSSTQSLIDALGQSAAYVYTICGRFFPHRRLRHVSTSKPPRRRRRRLGGHVDALLVLLLLLLIGCGGGSRGDGGARTSDDQSDEALGQRLEVVPGDVMRQHGQRPSVCRQDLVARSQSLALCRTPTTHRYLTMHQRRVSS